MNGAATSPVRRALESPSTPWIILALGVAATLALWRSVASVEHERARERLESRVRQIRRDMERRMHGYVQVLRGAEGLFASSIEVDRREWSAYMASLRLAEAHPLLRGVVYAPRLAAAEIAAHEAGVRAEGFSAYAVHPRDERDEYFPILFRDPLDGPTAKLLGVDLASEPVRRAAMGNARDTGRPATSGPVMSLIPGPKGPERSIALFVPVYRHGLPLDDVTARRAALGGFVSSGFRIEAFVTGVLESSEGAVHLRLYDGETPSAAHLLHDSAPDLAGAARGDLTAYATFEVPGRRWTLQVDAAQSRLVPSSSASTTLLAGIVFDLLLFLLVSSQVRLKQRATALARQTTQVLEKSRDELAASLAEKEVLLAEVHHRVKNNLQVISSLIQMQARRVKDAAAAAALTECRGRVNAIALIHEKLYESGDVANLGFGSYVRSLVDGIVQAARFPTQFVNVVVDVPDLRVPVERAIPCGLLINELLTNALEHGFPDSRAGTVRVELREEAKRMVLSVCDDGIGLPADLEPAQSPSLGLRLVAALTSQLKAKLEVVRGEGGGTKFSVIIAA